jgi:hypothetical protein
MTNFTSPNILQAKELTQLMLRHLLHLSSLFSQTNETSWNHYIAFAYFHQRVQRCSFFLVLQAHMKPHSIKHNRKSKLLFSLLLKKKTFIFFLITSPNDFYSTCISMNLLHILSQTLYSKWIDRTLSHLTITRKIFSTLQSSRFIQYKTVSRTDRIYQQKNNCSFTSCCRSSFLSSFFHCLVASFDSFLLRKSYDTNNTTNIITSINNNENCHWSSLSWFQQHDTWIFHFVHCLAWFSEISLSLPRYTWLLCQVVDLHSYQHTTLAWLHLLWLHLFAMTTFLPVG